MKTCRPSGAKSEGPYYYKYTAPTGAIEEVLILLHAFAFLRRIIMENPYTARNMIRDQAAFFGRNRAIEEIFTNLLQGFQNTSIVGERRIGKSSLLWHVSQPDVYQRYTQASDKPLRFIFFDLQRVAGLDQQAFFKLLSKSLAQQMSEAGVYTVDPADFDSRQEYFAELVQIACEDLQIVICLDEFDLIATNQDFNKDFLQNLRAYANQGQVAYITASREPLDVLCQETEHIMGSDFWNIFISPPLYLGLFEPEEALTLITNPSMQAGLPFPKAEIDWILETAGRHPLFLQIACHQCFELKQQKRAAGADTAISPIEQQQLADAFRLAAAPHFDQLWKRLKPIEKTILTNPPGLVSAGETKHAAAVLLRRGLLLKEQQLRPFCQSFAAFVRENALADHQTPPVVSANQLKEVERLNELWELLREKLHQLEKEKILATDVNVKFRIEQQIAEAASDRRQIEEQLKQSAEFEQGKPA